jgi:uncharacterized membrane protein
MSRRRQRERAATRQDETATGRAAGTAAGIPSRIAPQRLPAVDALRGVAILLMIAYHFSFDLRHFRVIGADFEHDPFWLGFRALIVSSFMLLVGIGLVLAGRAGAGMASAHFWKRCALIAACALAASAGSYLLFPQRFIYFGILHCIALASILASPCVPRPRLALALGAIIVVAGLTLAHPAFDPRWMSWIGFTTTKPATEDFVPLAPWSGVVFIGIALGQTLARVDFRPLAPVAAAPRWLQWLGRHSLAVYMVHQPVLLGLLWLTVRR